MIKDLVKEIFKLYLLVIKAWLILIFLFVAIKVFDVLFLEEDEPQKPVVLPPGIWRRDLEFTFNEDIKVPPRTSLIVLKYKIQYAFFMEVDKTKGWTLGHTKLFLQKISDQPQIIPANYTFKAAYYSDGRLLILPNSYFKKIISYNIKEVTENFCSNDPVYSIFCSDWLAINYKISRCYQYTQK